jgi:hypothetical protein
LEAKSKEPRQRRATSPQPTRSPAFSLFPSTPRLTVQDTSPSLMAPGRHAPLQRSNTSPAALSPSRPSFAPGPDNKVHANLMAPEPHPHIASQMSKKARNQQRQESSVMSKRVLDTPKSQTKPQNWSPSESQLTLDSPPSDANEEILKISPLSLKTKITEPAWQMSTPPRSRASTAASSSTTWQSNHSTSTSASSISTGAVASKPIKSQTSIPKLRSRSATTSSSVSSKRETLTSSTPPVSKVILTENEILEREQRLKSAAEASIARQISVSRQQRQLIIPIKPPSLPNSRPSFSLNTFTPVNVDREESPLGEVAAGESPLMRRSERKDSGKSQTKRLIAASVKPSTPTLVVVGDGEKEKAWSGKAMVNKRPILGEEASESAESAGSLVARKGSAVSHGHRKSERAVVERMSVPSSRV